MFLHNSNEAMARRFEDLAAALDAGLPADSLTPSGTALGEGLVGALTEPDWRLREDERAILRAAEHGGTLPAALRERAASRQRRADLIREIRGRLSYPAVLVLTLIPVSLVATMATGGGIGIAATAVGLVVAAVALFVWVVRRLPDPDFTGFGIPGVRPLLQSLGEVPYLECLGGLYAAGVGLVEAHGLATRTVRVGMVRSRLFVAEQTLEGGESSLTDALAQSGALHPDTLAILAPAEKAGSLEEALGRALQWRRHTLAQRSSIMAKTVGFGTYGIIALMVVVFVFQFYAGLYSSLPR